MNEHKNIRDYLGITDLKSFNQKVADVLKNEQQSGIDTQDSNEEDFEPVSFDSAKFDSFTVLPEVLDDTTLYQLSDLIDGKEHYEEEDVDEDNEITDFASPNTPDQILTSIGVIYIVGDNMPIAVATLYDPTVENYRGIIPVDYYELKSGHSLAGRVLIDAYAIKPEYRSIGLEDELRTLVEDVAPDVFIVVPQSDENMMELVKFSGYQPISEFTTDWDLTPVVLWIN
jgi:hypothetical protein